MKNKCSNFLKLIIIYFLFIISNHPLYSNSSADSLNNINKPVTVTEFKTKECDITLNDKTFLEDYRITAIDDSTFTISNEHNEQVIGTDKIFKIKFYRNGFFKGGMTALGVSLVFWIAEANIQNSPYAIAVFAILALPTFVAGGFIGNAIIPDYEFTFKGIDLPKRTKKLKMIVNEHSEK